MARKRTYSAASIIALLMLLVLAGCGVPAPPPEIATPTAGSQNPESDRSTFKTPVPPTPVQVGLTPLPVGPGTIYFVRGEKLWRIAPDGSGERQLSDLPVTSPPSPSPDGHYVAFLSGRDLYVLLPGESAEAPSKLASGDIADRQRIGWHPDSTTLGYITYDLETIGSEQAWSVSVEQGEPTLITTIQHEALGRGPTFERAVEWSPDGKWVMISSAANPFRLLRWPLATTRDDDIRDISGGEPEWSPESRTIIYTEALNGALALYDVLKNEEGEPYRNEAALVGTGLGEYAQGPLPLWSPASKGADSDLIAYRSRTNESVPQVAIRRRGGRELTPLDPLTNNPAWSPAGDRLVFETGEMKTAPLGKEWTPTGIAIATIDPEGEHTVSPLVQDAKWPAWGR